MGFKQEIQFEPTEIGLLPEDWNVVLLRDACSKIGSGLTPRGADKVYKTQGIALIRSQNVLNNRFVSDGLVYIDEKIAKEMENVEVLKQDVLLNITGDSVARCCTVPDSVLPARVNQHVSIIRTSAKYLDPVFLRYYLTSPRMQSYMLSIAQSGGTRNALTKGTIENFVVPKPDLREQREIADILSNLDSRISLNDETNKTLESIGEAIFKCWFIDFEFPNEEGKPYKSSGGEMVYNEESGKEMPKEWKVDRLGNYTIIKGRIGWKGLEVSEYVKTGPRIVGGTQLVDGHVNWDECPCVTKERYDESPEIMLRQADILMTKDGTIGKLAYVDELKEPATVASGIFVIRSNSSVVNQMYLLSYFRSDSFGKLVESRIEGSVVPHLYQRDIANILITLPNAQTAEKFALILGAIQQKIDTNSESLLLLRKIRDALLPKLMSGRIRVPFPKEGLKST